MTADTLTHILLEAEAIVEAEWARVHHDERLRERDVGEVLAELPAARPGPPRAVTATAEVGRPTTHAPRHRSRGCPLRRWPRLKVRATQRSPPDGQMCLFSSKSLVEQRR